jgi:hypothetical protein
MRRLLLLTAFLITTAPTARAAVTLAGDVTNKTVAIKIDGDFADWAAVPVAATDKSENTTPCDWRSVYMAHDDKQLYFRYITEANIDFDHAGAAYNIFLDTDQKTTTGFRGSTGEFPIGADYLVQGATLFGYTGDGTNWSWTPVGPLEHRVVGKEVEMAVPRRQIGNPTVGVDFFLFGDNEASGIGGKILDVCPDDALNRDGKQRKITHAL